MGDPLSPLDQERLQQALDLAAAVVGLTEPNPRVGCVIGHEDGRVLATGATQAVGGPHAEAAALAQARSNGIDLRGATAWVTLEPCAHHGRTPPCCDALIASGVARVVVALQDPYPEVAGRGLDRMRSAGIQVTLAGGAWARAARDLNIGFLSRVLRGRPWSRVKSACSLDGRTALDNGVSQWITGPEARLDGHRWRRRAGVVLTGIGTVLADDPRLDVRLVPTARQPRRAILDSRLRTPADSAVLSSPGTLIYHDEDHPSAGAVGQRLMDQGAELVMVGRSPDGAGLDLRTVMQDLARRGTNELHVEAGATLTGHWISEGHADELLVYMAPMLLGSGAPVATLPVLDALPERAPWRFEGGSQQVGQDLRLRLIRAPSDPDHWCPVPD